ncbi:MAG: DUF262 domain-containing protein [Salipiger marinus]|uniref:DUF262 domain-containing protein n=1 Tax=Salipiger marinus TaxID=555512 RepID=UPI004058DA07
MPEGAYLPRLRRERGEAAIRYVVKACSRKSKLHYWNEIDSGEAELGPIDTIEPDKETDLEVEKSYLESDQSEPVPPADIVSYNELRSCFDLYRLYATKKLEIQPDFQREVVWNKKDQSRFIDSLVKQLPIPSMCFSLDYKTQQWKVIDGLQRISSIIGFLGDAEWKVENLEDIHQLLRGATNASLRKTDEGDPRNLVYSTVENVSIPITVIRCDYSQPSHLQYLFTIFHRLNSGGVRLNNQEIRNCIFSGEFNTALKSFDKNNPDWKLIKKRIWGKVDRFRSVELLLRTLALSSRLKAYDGNLAKFLNDYMHSMANNADFDKIELDAKLAEVARVALVALDSYPAKKISITIVEAVLVGILSNLDTAKHHSKEMITNNFSQMLSDTAFKNSARYAIASEANVKARLNVSKSKFSGE